MFKQVKRWKNFLNFLQRMFNSSSIVALAGNDWKINAVKKMPVKIEMNFLLHLIFMLPAGFKTYLSDGK